jgi:predicted phage-related endonuclease
VIEVKTGRQTWEELPAGYYMQCQHYLDILGLNKAALVAVAGMTWHDYWIERDDFEIDIARQKAIDFQSCMFADQRPEWDGSESTYEAVRYQHPLIDENAQAKYDEAAEELRLIKSQVLDAMGRAKHAYMEVDGQKVRIASRQAKGEGLPYLVVKKGKK